MFGVPQEFKIVLEKRVKARNLNCFSTKTFNILYSSCFKFSISTILNSIAKRIFLWC